MVLEEDCGRRGRKNSSDVDASIGVHHWRLLGLVKIGAEHFLSSSNSTEGADEYAVELSSGESPVQPVEEGRREPQLKALPEEAE